MPIMVVTPLTFASFAKLAAVAFILHSELPEWATLPTFLAVLNGSGPVLSAKADGAGPPSPFDQRAAYATAVEKPGAAALAPRLNRGPFALAPSLPVDAVLGVVQSLSESPRDGRSMYDGASDLASALDQVRLRSAGHLGAGASAASADMDQTYGVSDTLGSAQHEQVTYIQAETSSPKSHEQRAEPALQGFMPSEPRRQHGPGQDQGPIAVAALDPYSGPLPDPPARCTPDSTSPNVTPGQIQGALDELQPGATLILAPGDYPGLHLSGRALDGATLRCAEPGQCRLANSTLTNVSGLTIDGISITGGNNGLALKGTENITIRCSTLKEQEGTGILVVNDAGNLKLHNNEIYNYDLGCNTLDPGQCKYKSDGSLLPKTDYGIRIHNAKNIDIVGNHLDGLFNHAISLKERVASALIVDNTFEACGRTCIEAGQEPTTDASGDRSCGVALIARNRFSNVKKPESPVVLLVKNIHTVIFRDNVFSNVTSRRVVMHVFTKVPATPTGKSPGALIDDGIPTDRTVTGSDAT
jgi:Periplasmic copper-binding protein (NosD)